MWPRRTGAQVRTLAFLSKASVTILYKPKKCQKTLDLNSETLIQSKHGIYVTFRILGFLPCYQHLKQISNTLGKVQLDIQHTNCPFYLCREKTFLLNPHLKIAEIPSKTDRETPKHNFTLSLSSIGVLVTNLERKSLF